MKKRNGFTLVEMLVVIVIIGLLAGITTVAFRGARQTVNANLIATEMSQLSMALDAYKNKYGEYPPDFSNDGEVERHIKKRWPRYEGTVNEFAQKLKSAWGIPSEADMRYVSPLIIWLGGLPSADDPKKPGGFYLNPTNPLDSTTGQREETFFDFDTKYIVDYKGVPTYCLNESPVVYFRSMFNMGYLNDDLMNKYFKYDNEGIESCAVPYYKSYDVNTNSGKWYEDGRFQLIHPGLDGTFGANDEITPRIVPTQKGTKSGDADNITNFLSSGTLESLYE